MRTIRVPLDRLGVPLAEFAAVLDAVRFHWNADQGNRHLAGAREALEWVAAMHDRNPLTGERQPADPIAILEVGIQTIEILNDVPEALPGLHREWVAGVFSALNWARGNQDRPPARAMKRGAN